MKSLFKLVSFIVCSFIIVISTPSYAALVASGSGTLSDTDTSYNNLMWMQDANYAQTTGYSPGGQMSWLEATNFVNLVNNGTYANLGFTDWRLPTAYNLDGTTVCDSRPRGASCRESEMGHLYYNESNSGSTLGSWFNNYTSQQRTSLYWTSTVDPTNSRRVMTQNFIGGGQSGWQYFATAMLVRDKTSTSVPEVGTLMLLSLGLLGLVATKRKRQQ